MNQRISGFKCLRIRFCESVINLEMRKFEIFTYVMILRIYVSINSVDPKIYEFQNPYWVQISEFVNLESRACV